MNKEKNNPNREQERADDCSANIAAALNRMSQPGYMNTIPEMSALLAGLVARVVEAMLNRDENVFSKAMKPEVEKFAAMLLGEDASKHPLKGFNQPGGIDVWIRSERDCGEVTDPRQVVEGAVWQFVSDTVEAVNYSADERTPEVLAKSNCDLLMHQYVHLFLGLPDLALMAAAREEDEDSGEQD